MARETNQTSSSPKLIHCKVIGGTQADIYDIGIAMREFTKKAPFKIEAIVTNDKVELRDVDFLLKELYTLKKQIEKEKLLE